MINKLINLANYLDEAGFKKEAGETRRFVKHSNSSLAKVFNQEYEDDKLTHYVKPNDREPYWIEHSVENRMPIENFPEELDTIQSTLDEFIKDYAPNTRNSERLLAFLKQYPFFKSRLFYIHAFERDGIDFGEREADWEEDKSFIETDEDLYYYFYEWLKREAERINFYFIRGPDIPAYQGAGGSMKKLGMASEFDIYLISYEEVCSKIDEECSSGATRDEKGKRWLRRLRRSNKRRYYEYIAKYCTTEYYCDQQSTLSGWKSRDAASKKTTITHELQHAFSQLFGLLMRDPKPPRGGGFVDSTGEKWERGYGSSETPQDDLWLGRSPRSIVKEPPFIVNYNESEDDYNERMRREQASYDEQKVKLDREYGAIEEKYNLEYEMYEKDLEAWRRANYGRNAIPSEKTLGNLPINTPNERPTPPERIPYRARDGYRDLEDQNLLEHRSYPPWDEESLSPYFALDRIFHSKWLWDSDEQQDPRDPYNGITTQVFGKDWRRLVSYTSEGEEQRAFLHKARSTLEKDSADDADFNNKLSLFIDQLCKEKQLLMSKMREIEKRFWANPSKPPRKYNQRGREELSDEEYEAKERAEEQADLEEDEINRAIEEIENKHQVYMRNEPPWGIDWDLAEREGEEVVADHKRLDELYKKINEIWDKKMTEMFTLEARYIPNLYILPHPDLKDISDEQRRENFNEIMNEGWALSPSLLYTLICDDKNDLIKNIDSLVVRETSGPTYASKNLRRLSLKRINKTATGLDNATVVKKLQF
jgi:hypothetical protein